MEFMNMPSLVDMFMTIYVDCTYNGGSRSVRTRSKKHFATLYVYTETESIVPIDMLTA
jgi:hypothetical protein